MPVFIVVQQYYCVLRQLFWEQRVPTRSLHMYPRSYLPHLSRLRVKKRTVLLPHRTILLHKVKRFATREGEIKQ